MHVVEEGRGHVQEAEDWNQGRCQGKELRILDFLDSKGGPPPATEVAWGEKAADPDAEVAREQRVARTGEATTAAEIGLQGGEEAEDLDRYHRREGTPAKVGREEKTAEQAREQGVARKGKEILKG